jgi:hypothetical protein
MQELSACGPVVAIGPWSHKAVMDVYHRSRAAVSVPILDRERALAPLRPDHQDVTAEVGSTKQGR